MTGSDDLAVRAATSSPRRTPWQAVALEVTAALVAAAAAVMIPVHYLAVRVTFFGAEAVIHDEDVRFYWAVVGVLACGVAASFAGARWRRAGRSFAWHVLVALVGVAVALGFSVTESGPVQDLDRDDRVRQEQADRPGNAVCHSGGDSDECVGG